MLPEAVMNRFSIQLPSLFRASVCKRESRLLYHSLQSVLESQIAKVFLKLTLCSETVGFVSRQKVPFQ